MNRRKRKRKFKKVVYFGNDTPSLAGAGEACLHFSGNALKGHGQCALHRSCLRGGEGYGGGAAQTGSKRYAAVVGFGIDGRAGGYALDGDALVGGVGERDWGGRGGADRDVAEVDEDRIDDDGGDRPNSGEGDGLRRIASVVGKGERSSFGAGLGRGEDYGDDATLACNIGWERGLAGQIEAEAIEPDSNEYARRAYTYAQLTGYVWMGVSSWGI